MTAVLIIAGWSALIGVMLIWNHCAHFSGSSNCSPLPAAADDCGAGVEWTRACPAPVEPVDVFPSAHEVM